MVVTPVQLSASRCFNGVQKVFQHKSDVLGCQMKYGVYVPDSAMESQGRQHPILFYLSGITCTEENFIIKSGMQRWASKNGILVVNPDTSPRDIGHDFDEGYAAGFYLDATEGKWSKHFHMYSYLIKEFVPMVFIQFNDTVDLRRCGLFGHSMGGHGALTIGLKHPDVFKSISALSPLCNPSESPLAKSYFEKYLGTNKEEEWAKYNATDLARAYNGPARKILVDQGASDQLLSSGHLLPEALLAVKNPDIEFDYRLRKGYDHGYFYVATFIEEHFDHHLQQWAAGQ